MRRLWLAPVAVLAVLAVGCGNGDDYDDGGLPGTWTTAPPVIDGPMQEAAGAVIGDRVYLVGGFDAQSQVLSAVRIFDTAAGTWSTGPSLPVAIHHANVAAVDGTLYVVGALLGRSFQPTGRVFRWNPATETAWTELPPMPDATEVGAAVTGVIDGVIVIAGGLDRLGAAALVLSFDPRTGAWDHTLPRLPDGRDHACGGVIDGRLVVAGGRSVSIASITADVRALAPGVGWTALAPMPTARAGIACGIVGGRLLVVGGEGNPAASTGVFAEVEAYDPATNTWASLAPMRTPRHGMPGAVVGARLYVPGGGTIESFSAVDVHEVFELP